MSVPNEKYKAHSEYMAPITMGIPFDNNHMLSINDPGGDSVNRTYVPDQDILNCVPGAFAGMCQLIQNVDIDASQDKLGISDDEMLKAVKAMRYLLSNDAIQHDSVVDAYRASGILDCGWQARTWVMKNLGDMMVRMWYEGAKSRVTQHRKYYDYYVNEAADLVAKSIKENRM